MVEINLKICSKNYKRIILEMLLIINFKLNSDMIEYYFQQLICQLYSLINRNKIKNNEAI